MKSCVFLSSSQSGWCLLKSPIHSMWSSADGRIRAISVSRNVDSSSSVLLDVQSLYILNIVQRPKVPRSCMIMTSGDGKGICCHAFVLSDLLTSVTALDMR